jgi:hypothetical protein
MGSGDSDVPAGSGITEVTDCARATPEAAMVTRADVFIVVVECERLVGVMICVCVCV